MFRQLLVNPLFNLLVLIYALLPGHDFGLSLVVMTVLVRLALWPLVNKQLHSQRALQKLAPEAAKVRVQAGGDKTKESQLLMQLYKDKGVSPFSSLLPLFVQLPILIALFIMIQEIVKDGQIASLAYEPVRNLPFVRDLISGAVKFNPSLLGLIDLAKPSLLLAIAAGATQYLQAKQLAPSKSNDPQAKALAATTIIFPFLTIFIAMTLPSALSLFWTVTSLVAMVQQHLVLHRDADDLHDAAVNKPPTPAATAAALQSAPKPKKKKKRKGNQR